METILLEGYSIGSEINLKKYMKEIFNEEWKKSWEEPITIEKGNSKAYVFAFGAVVFKNADESFKKEVFKSLRKYVLERREKPLVEEFKIKVFEEQKEMQSFLKKPITKNFLVIEEEAVALKKSLKEETIRIIAFAIAQAVSLERIEEKVENLMDSLESTIEKIRKSLIFLNRGRVTSYLFETSSIKYDILSNLMLLEEPELGWEYEELSNVYYQVRNYFEINKRIENITRELNFISESSNYLMEILAEKRSEILELVIIILILLEILIGFIKI
ncbi:MAG: RMD1 family protein [Candidatus Micrarchaeales archaeon]